VVIRADGHTAIVGEVAYFQATPAIFVGWWTYSTELQNHFQRTEMASRITSRITSNIFPIG
jgi:hypothetical protein